MKNIFHKNFFLWSLFLLTSVLLTAGILWYAKETEKKIVETQKVSLTQNEKILEKVKEGKKQREVEVSAPETATNKKGIITPIKGTDEAWYAIPEMGIQMRLNKETAKDLIYFYDTKVDGVYFSYKTLMTLDSGCNAESGIGGYLGKIQGTPKEADRKLCHQQEGNSCSYFESQQKQLRNIRQFETFFILFLRPQSPCWSPKNDDVFRYNISEQKGSGAKNIEDAFSTIEAIF